VCGIRPLVRLSEFWSDEKSGALIAGDAVWARGSR
jgi:hypothetical protein